MPLQLQNTLTRRKETFEPLDPYHVRLYVCGPTVYQRIHVGNARPLVVFDVLYRLLMLSYPRVSYVRNITDIDDKIITQAKWNGEAIDTLTARTFEAFMADSEALGCLSPTHQPRATDHVSGMIAMIETLIEKDVAYEAEGHVLFHVPAMADYGELSGRSRDEQIAGARVDIAPYKRDPADFVLWKPSADDVPGWESPWGRGRPGWHIECSAMSEAFLGVPFDIHGGGLDLIFPHHENEIAQTRCAHGSAQMARFWIHNGFVSMSGEKMSKSVGNVVTVENALRAYPGEAIRFWILGAHYRQPLDCSDEALTDAKKTLDRFYSALDRAADGEGLASPSPAMIDALEDDLNTPKAIAVLHEALGRLNRADDDERHVFASMLKADAGLLGLLQQPPEAWLRSSNLDAAEIERQIEVRREARTAKNFAEADRIRNELAASGIILEDDASGTTWRKA